MGRLGFGIGRNYEIRPEELASYVRHAEALGYDTWVVPEAWGRDAMVTLGFLAARTSRIRFLTGIVTIYGRSPTMLAQAAATVDDSSQGRLSLGIGVTGPKVAEDWHGGTWKSPLQRTREYVDIIRLVLSGQRVNYDGSFFHLKDFRLQFQPYRDRIPIYIGAFGPKNLQLAGEIADGWVAAEVVSTRIGDFLAEIRKGAARVARPLDGFEATMSAQLCFGGRQELAAKLLRQDIAYRIGGLGPFHYEAVARQGFGEECATIKRLWAEFKRDEAAAYVTDEMVAKLCFVGDAQGARRHIEQLRQAGVTLPVIGVPKGVTHDMILATMEALAP